MATKIAPLFEPQAGTVAWMRDCIKRGLARPFYEVTLMTPGLASVLLASNPQNRGLSMVKVTQFVADMREGRWQLNGEAIILSKEGLLNDGQHRLTAVVEANEPVPMTVGFGFERETRHTLDLGMARTAGDISAMKGVENANIAASIARMALSYEATAGRSVGSVNRVSTPEIVARVENDPRIIDSASFASAHGRRAPGVAPSAVGFCHYVFAAVSPRDAESYLAEVCSGAGLQKGDPAFAVREQLINRVAKGRRDRSQAIELIFRGFVAVRERRRLNLAKSLNEGLPEVR